MLTFSYRSARSKKTKAKVDSDDMSSYVNSPSSTAKIWRETFGSPVDLSKCRTKKSKVSSEKTLEKAEVQEEPEKVTEVADLGESGSQKVDNGSDTVCQPSAGSVSI